MPGRPEREVVGPEWEKIKATSLIIPYDSWTELSKFIMKVCKDWGRCTEEEVPQVEAHIHAIDSKIQHRLF